MAAYPATRLLFAPYTSIPTSLDTATAVYLTLGEALEIFAKASAGAGTLTLLKWIPEANAGAGRWYPYQNPVPIDAAVNNGQTHARWIIDLDYPAYWQLLATASGMVTPVISEAFMQGIRV